MEEQDRRAERWTGAKHPVWGFFAGAALFGLPFGLVGGALLGGRWLVGVTIGLVVGLVFAAGATYVQFLIDRRNGLWD